MEAHLREKSLLVLFDLTIKDISLQKELEIAKREQDFEKVRYCQIAIAGINKGFDSISGFMGYKF